jgi:peptidoglycan/LPS O-acetylase OafA/YrhL
VVKQTKNGGNAESEVLARVQSRGMVNPSVDSRIPVEKEASRATKTGYRLSFLDCIRGIAALLVVLQHSFETAYPRFEAWCQGHINFGLFGVVSFFLVSGFIIPATLQRKPTLAAFWKARFFRLFPMYWASLVAGLILGAIGWYHSFPSQYFAQHPVRLAVANASMLQEFVRIPDVIGIYWTLSLELVFYVLCSVLTVVGLVRHALLWAWLSILGSVALNAAVALLFHRSVPAGRMGLLVTCFFGTLLYKIFTDEIKATVLWSIVPVLAFSLAFGLWLRFAKYPSPGEELLTLKETLVSWLAAYLFVGLLFALRKRHFPMWLQWLGRISYSVYLVHALLLGVPGSQFGIPWIIGIMALSILVAATTYRFIEQPPLAWSKGKPAPKSFKDAA